MRGPGAVPGLYATESALNELAERLKIDPVRLRILNEPTIDEGRGLPFSSRHLLECFALGAEKFGWSSARRQSARCGATASRSGGAWRAARGWRARFAAQANVQLRDDGTVRVACGTQDIGTGTSTILAQLARGRTGAPLGRVEVALGDTALPAGPISGGSMATASVVPAVFAGGRRRDRLAAPAGSDHAGLAVREAPARGPDLRRRAGARRRPAVRGGVPFADVLRRGP